jgi:IS30 family transposase
MRSYSHLSENERDQIGVLRAAGRSMGAIAPALGRARATISRELRRNALPSGGYSPLHAAGAYQLRRQSEVILERGAALRLFVGDPHAEGWLVEIRERTAAEGHRLRDNLRLHLPDWTEGRGLLAVFDAPPQTPSSASRQGLARHHQGSTLDP